MSDRAISRWTGVFGLDPSVANAYEDLRCTVRIRGNATAEQFRQIHEAVLATSPNFYNITKAITARPRLVVS